MSFEEKFISMIRAQVPIIWVQSYEEERVIKHIIDIFKETFPSFDVNTWDNVSGLCQYDINADNNLYKVSEGDKTIRDVKIFDYIMKKANEVDSSFKKNAFILRDFDDVIESYAMRRAMKNYVEYKYFNKYCPIIITSVSNVVHPAIQKLATVLEYDTLSKEELFVKLDKLNEYIDCKNGDRTSENQIEFILEKDYDKISDALLGLTSIQVSNNLLRSVAIFNKVDVQFLHELRKEALKNNNLLTIIEPNASINDIGGHKVLKEWINEIKQLNTPEAKEYGCSKPKGMLCLGAPGTGKTYFAEIIATEFKVPYIKLDMSKIMDKAVGESEKRMSNALNTVKAMAPCVLLIDEIEKALSGMGSSNMSDGGTIARVIGNVLQFLNDNEEVFVIATSNDISQLPPEMYRSGRFDAIWYFAMPNIEERIEIIKLYLSKFNKTYSDKDINIIATETDHFTGAELKQLANTALKKSFLRQLKDNNKTIILQDLRLAKEEINPIYNLAKGNINALEAFATNAARYTNVSKHKTTSENTMRLKRL